MLEEWQVANEERLKKLGDMETELHASIAKLGPSSFVVPIDANQKDKKNSVKRVQPKRVAERAKEDIENEEAPDAAIETESAVDAATKTEKVLDAPMETEEATTRNDVESALEGELQSIGGPQGICRR